MGPSIPPAQANNNQSNNNSHNNSSNSNNNHHNHHNNNNNSRSSAHVRKYFVVLHDCLAVKFVAVGQNSGPGPGPGLNLNLNPNPNQRPGAGGGGTGTGGTSSRSRRNSEHYGELGNCGLGQQYGGAINKNSLGNNIASLASATSAPTATVNGLTLFKGFRDANLKCYWNGPIVECFQNIEYRGFVLPSTIFISAIPKFTLILRSAWARQMIRSPADFKIQFIGEIEDVICEPIKQSQWSPLSDSLCWTILEMTGRGEEAFVETICGALSKCYPAMVQPSRELVYQTLEKLTREKKVYQTSRGYFIVTPDTFRYMNAATCTPLNDFTSSRSFLTLDALINSHQEQEDPCSSSRSRHESAGRHSWDSRASTDNTLLLQHSTSTTSKRLQSQTMVNVGGAGGGGERQAQARLKRHNSLKIFRQKENISPGNPHQNPTAHYRSSLGARSLSLRFSKSIPYNVNAAVNGDGEREGREGDPMTYERQLAAQLELQDNDEDEEDEDEKDEKGEGSKNKKGKQSLLSKLFGFGRWSTKRSSRKKKTDGEKESQKLSQSQSTINGSASNKNGGKSATGNFPTISNTNKNTSLSSRRASTSISTESGGDLTLNCQDGDGDADYFLENSRSSRTRHASTMDDLESGCFTLERNTMLDSADDDHLHIPHHHYELANHRSMSSSSTPKWNSLPKRSYRSQSRRSIVTMADKDNDHDHDYDRDHEHENGGPLYATPSPTCPTPGSGISSTTPFQRASSTFSGSLGYQSASQGGPISPCPSTSETYTSGHGNANDNKTCLYPNSNTYKNYYDFYRRRCPSYMSYNPSTRSTTCSPMPRSNSSKPLYETISDRPKTTSNNNNNSSNNNNTSSSSCTIKPKIVVGNDGDSQVINDANNIHSNFSRNNNNKNLSSSTSAMPMTTMLTHNVKSTTNTNTEIELLVPIMGKFSPTTAISFANGNTQIRLENQRPTNQTTTTTTTAAKMLSSNNNNNSGNIKSKNGDEPTTSEVKTIVNGDGMIETHFDCWHGGQLIKSSIDFYKSQCQNKEQSKDGPVKNDDDKSSSSSSSSSIGTIGNNIGASNKEIVEKTVISC